MEAHSAESTFTRSSRFEINDIEFTDIQIDERRVIAKGHSWNRFELLISFIGAIWMEKWRRFSNKLAVIGTTMAISPMLLSLFSGMGFLFWYYVGTYYLALLSMGVGVILVLIWAFFKKEAIKIYTPSETFRLEGYAGFIDEVWAAITSRQHLRNV
ncbi:MAG: hypothetical protein GF309_06965 [Candidatus Lokiarchaeota archaeon]|nr:hypothetical protein [Candidatus Lokiarchaeota archaeon]